MYVSVTLRNPNISRATRKRSITCASVTLRNVTAGRPLKSAGRNPPRATTARDDGDAVRTQRSGGQPEYEPIRAAYNRLAQLSTCTYLLQRCWTVARDVGAVPRHSLREALHCVCVSLVIIIISCRSSAVVAASACGFGRSIKDAGWTLGCLWFPFRQNTKR